MKHIIIALTTFSLGMSLPGEERIDTFRKWAKQYIRLYKEEELKRPPIFKQDNKAIRKDFVETLNMLGLEAIHSTTGGLPKDKKKWRAPRMVWSAGNTLFMANPSDFVQVGPEWTINRWKKGLDTARKDKENKIAPSQKLHFDFALRYFTRLTFMHSENPFDRNAKIIHTDLSLEYGDERDKVKLTGLEIDTFEGWVEDYVRIDGDANLKDSFIFKQNNKAIRADFVEFLNMAGLKSIHPRGLPKDKKDWLIPRNVWAEGDHLFILNVTDSKFINYKETPKMWKEGLDISKKDKANKIPREKKLLFDFALFYFKKLTIISSKAPYDEKRKDNVVELSLEYGDDRDKIRPHADAD